MSDLRSKAYLRTLDLVSEGPIVGFPDLPERCTYLDEVPIVSPSGERNYSGVQIATLGMADAAASFGFPGSESEVSVNAELKISAGAVERTISAATVTGCRINVSVPQLTKTSASGAIDGAVVQYRILVSSAGGAFVPQSLGVNWSRAADVSAMPVTSAVAFGVRGRVKWTPVFSQHWGVTHANAKNGDSYGWITDKAAAKVRIEYRKDAGAWVTFGDFDLSGRSDRPIYGAPFERYFYSAGAMDIGVWQARVTLLSGDGFVEIADFEEGLPATTLEISGRAMSRYQRSHYFRLPGSAPWVVRLERMTPDSSDPYLQNRLYWDSYTEVNEAQFSFPGSSLIRMSIDAEQVTKIPARAYRLRGRLISVPTNYDPVTRVYTGIWDGTFKTAWTDNPAWVFYDLVVNQRYGLGDLVPSGMVDKWALYSIAKYCDELVPDGVGGQEPRFTCNVYLQTRQEAMRLLADLASVFRGMVYWSAAGLQAVQDKPSDAVSVFTNANVVDGVFSYSNSNQATRCNVALVTWNDPSDFYRQKVEYVSDDALIASWGYVQERQVTAFCVTSRGQARRVGLWQLFTDAEEGEVVAFDTGLAGLIPRPGEVIKVMDRLVSSDRLSGRIVAVDASSVTIDAPISYVAGQVYRMTIPLADGSLQERQVSQSAPGQQFQFLSGGFSSMPALGSVFILESDAVVATSWRVLTVQERGGIYSITALRHFAKKFDLIDYGVGVIDEVVSTGGSVVMVSAPEGITVAESLYESASEVRVRLDVSWPSVAYASRYRFRWRVNGGNWVYEPEMISPTCVLLDVQPGEYEIEVSSVSLIGSQSQPALKVVQVFGKSAAPDALSGLSMSVIGEQAQLSWGLSPDLDVRIGGYVVVRFNQDVSPSAKWEEAQEVGRFPGAAVSGVVPAMSGTWFVKALDSSNNYSALAARLVTSAPSAAVFNAVAVTDQAAVGFAGVCSGAAAVSGVLKLASQTPCDSISDLDGVGNWDYEGGVVLVGEYQFDAPVDLGDIFSARLTARLTMLLIDLQSSVDAVANFDALDLIDGGVVDDVSVTVYVDTTADDPASGVAVWSGWSPLVLSDYKARGFRFKAVIETSDPMHSVELTQLTVNVDMRDRLESGSLVSSPAGSRVTFSRPFKTTPGVFPSGALATGEYFEVGNKDTTGFDIRFFNAGGSGVSRVCEWIAKGY